jgi:hypothetical protein
MSKYVKYPTTFHLPWSLGISKDDEVLKSTEHFVGKIVVVTEKMDGESTSLYSDYLHARSLDSRDHESRHWIKSFHNQMKHEIPDNWRICGENVYAQHSLGYDKLESYFLLFSIWEDNVRLSWDETIQFSKLLNIKTVPVLYIGIWDEKIIKSCYTGLSKCGDESEGYVVTLSERFHFNDFEKSIAKFVRKDHVQTNKHWMHQKVIPNKLIV